MSCLQDPSAAFRHDSTNIKNWKLCWNCRRAAGEDHEIHLGNAEVRGTGRGDLQVAVQRHKFGVLHIHNLQETLKKKGVDFSDARQILEICNPPEGGDTLGMYSLGLMYENGYGVEKDYQQAVMLYRKAAKGGVQHVKDALSA